MVRMVCQIERLSLRKYIALRVWKLQNNKTGGSDRLVGRPSGDMGLDTLQGRQDLAKLKWWYILATMSSDKYPKKLFDQV